MLNRSAYQLLLQWKDSENRKALLVDGARQIGKTFLIEEFARREYPSYIKIDFLTDSQAATTLAGTKSAREVIEALSLIVGRRIIAGQTLIFFDEVQEAPNLVTFSKYLIQDGRFPIIMSGSMLGVELNRAKSFPLGYLSEICMYPLDFREFCEALGVPQSVLERVQKCFREKEPVEETVHERLIDVFRLYVIIGGMPEAVQTYLNNDYDLGAVREVQTSLVRLYRDDIAKHAGDRALQVKAIYDAIPSQLSKENKRFLLKQIKVDAKFERYAKDFAWLVGAKAALKTTCVDDPKPMLKRSEEENRFKLYLSDVGMLMSQYSSDVALAARSGSKQVNFGSVYENAVAQELMAADVPLHYYHHTRLGEVDFVAEKAGAVLPIEVKSGKSYRRHVALNNLLRSDEYGINEAYVISEANVSTESREGSTVHYLPLYMLPFIAEELRGPSLEGVSVAPPTW